MAKFMAQSVNQAHFEMTREDKRIARAAQMQATRDGRNEMAGDTRNAAEVAQQKAQIMAREMQMKMIARDDQASEAPISKFQASPSLLQYHDTKAAGEVPSYPFVQRNISIQVTRVAPILKTKIAFELP